VSQRRVQIESAPASDGDRVETKEGETAHGWKKKNTFQAMTLQTPVERYRHTQRGGEEVSDTNEKPASGRISREGKEGNLEGDVNGVSGSVAQNGDQVEGKWKRGCKDWK